MEESIEEQHIGEEESTAGSSSAIFSELKLCCLQLLKLHQNPAKNTSAVSNLLHLLRRSPPQPLQPFFDYTLFPLLLLLDASVDCRSTQKDESRERSIISNFSEIPLKVGDILGEGVLNCLEELLKKCSLASVDQLVVLLKKLTRGALLSPLEASEEFREGVIRCFKAMLLNLHPCSDESCPCKKVSYWPALIEIESLRLQPVSKCDLKREECLLAFLQSETASAAVGHWLSLLLKAADTEARRELRGSATIRIESFTTLRMLIAKVGTADALAFFLPGVVSQIGKVLDTSRTMISGPAGSARALDEAIRGLAEFLMIVLEDTENSSSISVPHDNVAPLESDGEKSPLLVLEELRRLPNQMQDHGKVVSNGLTEAGDGDILVRDSIEKGNFSSRNMSRSLRVCRTRHWITDTCSHVDKLLSATFPNLCMHPSKRVRQGLLAAIHGFLTKCCYTLKNSRLMLLECLCILVCDDSEEVSLAAQAFFRSLSSSHGRLHMKHDFVQIFRRLIEKLPKVVLENEESLALSHAQKLLVVIYFSGPQLVTDYLLQSPVTAAKFLDVFSLCMSQNSVYAGSLEKHIITTKSSSGFMRSIAEMKAITDANSENFGYSESRKTKAPYLAESIADEYELPRMPPWFVHVGSQKLYNALAGILRLVGLSLFADSRSEGGLSIIVDLPLENLRKLVSDVRIKEYNKESWHSWYKRTGSGQVLRRASTAASVLNEMLFGLSDQAISSFSKMFSKSKVGWRELKHNEDGNQPGMVDDTTSIDLAWRICWDKGSRSQVVDSVGSVLHEYLSSEIWSLPVDRKDLFQQSHAEERDMNLYFFQDTAMLHQVIIDGVGIFCMCLGKDFYSSGFLHSSLWLLLQNLISSNFLVKSAADAVLHIIAATHEYETVGHLVIENSDYIIDSICRELRHLDLNPKVPNILAAMLSYIGVAQKMLPLLEEPMRAVSAELEILQRHQHPDLTISFLKAVAEIVKASKHEASSLPDQSLSFSKNVKDKLFDLEKKTGMLSNETWHFSDDGDIDLDSREPGTSINSSDPDMQIEEWESLLFKLNDSRRYRRTVGSMAGSCIIAATPLLSSAEPIPCLLALDIVEDGVFAISKVEEAYKYEKEAKEAIEEALSLCSFHSLKDTLDDDETGENRLLPAANKIWPFLVSCVRNKNPLAVRRCMRAISNIVQICGGDFFSRRFYTDGVHFWNLLSTSPFQRRPLSKEKVPLQLPYRAKSPSSEDSVAETSDLKVQAAVLDMLADLSKNKRSSSALEAVLKKVCGLVVGIACSSVKGLREAAINALAGLSSIDPDLVWLLLADVYYSKKSNEISPPSNKFPTISQVLPPPSSTKQYLYVVYGGQSYGFDVDFNSVEIVLRTLHSQVFTSQMY